MNKQQYLAAPEITEFIFFFKQLLSGQQGSFIQNYVPEKNKSKPFNILSFKEAFENYFWEGKDYIHSQNTLNELAKKLREAIDSNNQTEALINSLRVLDWGGVVVRHPVRWLVNAHENKLLCRKLIQCRSLLDSDSDEGFELFDGNIELRSDSATTKLFSLISNRSVIYDDRVGAAMAAIARAFLSKSNAHKVPETLNFMRGSGKRNPSDKIYKFRNKKSGELHALSNLKTNWILGELAQSEEFMVAFNSSTNLDSSSISERMRILEAALFMIGYDITTIESIG
ncbi:hypothetical protein J1N51_11425 [Psychrosphaera ytuae]|uniref:Uncharacterized protein n=1 Tax=Psychrosphaera ytuae TaxID=2820710 RepID=A0A975DA33_9GAMM|nr:hypothetical protein [Psychrosphaera ytuae]QTH63336.1 hypothetical protein J1N51_11425 [Psychrosphaera ytuae]